jgi:hypothetical protein
MGRRALSLAIATVGLFGATGTAAARPAPCPAARYVPEDGPLLPGAREQPPSLPAPLPAEPRLFLDRVGAWR